MTEQTSMTNLGKVDHIVVLMLENRSFDHMLGYLSLEGGRGDVDGLREEFANEHGGRNYPVHHLDSTVIEDDPDHSASAVDLQVAGGKMDGFVTSYAETLAHNEGPLSGVPLFERRGRDDVHHDRIRRGAAGRASHEGGHPHLLSPAAPRPIRRDPAPAGSRRPRR